MRKIILLMIMTVAMKASWAQLELTPHVSYEIPLDELKWIYEPGKSYALTIAKTDKYKKKRTSWGGTIGYARFTPKQDLFYYLVNEDEIGTIRYEDYYLYQLTFNTRRDFILNKSLELFVGAEVGYHYVKYAYVSQDIFTSEDATTVESRVALSPRAGVNVILLKNVSAFIQSRYTASISPSDNSTHIMNYRWSNGIGLNFRFE